MTPEATKIAAALKKRLDDEVAKGRITRAHFTTQLALNFAVEAIAEGLGVDAAEFRRACDIPRLLAYFI